MPNNANVITTLKRTVLIVEDEDINAEILKEILCEEFNCLEAENGLEAFKVLESSDVPISLILLDINMPVMNGFVFLEKIRARDDFRRIPIIVLTSDKENELQCLRLGAVDFIAKPYDLPEIIIARVKRSIELSEDRSLIQKAQRDEVTGVYISEVFSEYAQKMDSFHPNKDFDLAIIDINRFSMINALYGRKEGDRVLATLASVLIEAVRKRNGIIGKYQGHSFLMYMDRQEEYRSFLNEIEGKLKGALDNRNLILKIGIYPVHDKSEPFDVRIDKVKQTCEVIRDSNIDSINIFDDEAEKKAILEDTLVKDLGRALSERQFQIHYQPKIAIQGNKYRIAGAEALVRWIHPEYGFISPGTFIPLFEANGQIKFIDQYVWQEAGRMVKRIKETVGMEIPISVNVSRLDMFDESIVNTFLSITKEDGIDPKNLHIEITESAYSQEINQIVNVANHFRERGFLIEIDDFGSGYSSLNSLTSLPFDIIKLDMKFTKELDKNEKTEKMVAIVGDIAKFFNAKLIAEGAETAEQVAKLRQYGYDVVQGYYFSKPLKEDDFIEYVKNHLKED